LGDGGAPLSPEPPAVVSLLAGRLAKLGFGATLVDLAARGWFEVRAHAGPGGQAAWGPGASVMCVVPAEAPGGPLTPFERRVVAHVALRAGARGEVPAPALSDGFGGGEAEFMSAFRDEVDAEARRRGLTRPRLSARRIALLCLLLLIPAGALLAAVTAAGKHGALAYAGGLCFVGCWVTIGVGTTRRRSAAGQAALGRWRSAVAAAPGGAASLAASRGEGRLPAYAAALGAAPAALAVFAQGGTNVAWSRYRGSWQQIEIETNTWPWPRSCLILLAFIFGPVLYLTAAIWLGTHGMAVLAEEMVALVVVGAIVGVGVWLARRSLFARFAEFDGQVIRQWMVKGDSESPDQYHVAIDDGTRAKAWDLEIGSEPYRLLTPGTFVHARVNLRKREQVTVEPVEPPAVARPLAEVAADQERAVTGGLPDPAGLVMAAEAAAVLGTPVQGKHLGGPSGSRTMIWQPTRTARPMLRIEVRPAGSGRPAPPAAQPVPGVADGYLLGQSAVLTVPPLTVTISTHGTVLAGAGPAGAGLAGAGPAGADVVLAGLLPVVEARLRQLGGSPLCERLPGFVRND